MPKAAEAFRTISEVADSLEVPKHVLRFWELKFPQIKPMKRGGGRRYYRPTDVELLRGIRHLLHAEGYTIKGVQKILREQGIDHVKSAGRTPGDAETPVTTAAASPAAQADGATPPKARRTKRAPEASAPAGPPDAEAPTDRAILERLLGELRACRQRLAAVGPAASGGMRRAPAV